MASKQEYSFAMPNLQDADCSCILCASFKVSKAELDAFIASGESDAETIEMLRSQLYPLQPFKQHRLINIETMELVDSPTRVENYKTNVSIIDNKPKKPTKKSSKTKGAAQAMPQVEQQQQLEPLMPFGLPPSEQPWGKVLLKHIRSLKRDKKAMYINAPFDWKAQNVLDYPLIIKHPMDLSTVEENIVAGKYKEPAECISDVRLIFRNAYLYNKPGTSVYINAKDLSQRFELFIHNL